MGILGIGQVSVYLFSVCEKFYKCYKKKYNCYMCVVVNSLYEDKYNEFVF